MTNIRFKPEPGGVILPSVRLREYAQVAKNVLALGSQKLDAHRHQRSQRGKVTLDPTQKTRAMNALWPMQVWSNSGALRTAANPPG